MTSSDEPAAGPVPGEERSPREVAKEATESVVKHATFMLRAYRSESAIYGVVLVSSLIAIGWREDTDLQVLLFTLGAVVVFWLAHVYAGTVSREETGEPRLRAIVAAALTSAAHSAGMLLAMVLPTIFLGLAALNVLDEYVAYYLALWVGVVVLAVIGWYTAMRRGGHWGWWVLSAVVTASFGLIVIWLGSLVH